MFPYSTKGVSATPHEAPPVYRCGDRHWHFKPHKHHNDLIVKPWWRRHEYPEKRKYPSDTTIVYVQGRGDEAFTLDTQYENGFCDLKSGEREIWCRGRYDKLDRALWRVEELSLTPWVGKQEEMPPPYETLSSSSSSSSSPPGYSPTDSNLSTDQHYYDDVQEQRREGLNKK